MTADSRMAAMILSSPPQFGQCSISISKTRLSSRAQLMRAGKTSHTIHVGRASKTTPAKDATAILTSIGLAVAETKPNKIAVSTLTSKIANDPFRPTELADEFISVT